MDDPLTALPVGQSDYDANTFFPLFSKYIYKLVNDTNSVRRSTFSVLQDFMEDGVCYLELRTTPRSSETMTKDAYVYVVLDTIDSFPRGSYSRPKDEEDKMAVYLILSIDRKMTAEEALNVVNLAIRYKTRTVFNRYKSRKKRGVVGIDLCGNPSIPCDVSKFREAFAKAKANGLKVSLHFAEVPTSSSGEELETLLSFNPDRLGHMIHVNDEFREDIKKRKLALELCLSCNVHAKLITGGFEGHHFKEWWREKDRGPIALSVGFHHSNTLQNNWIYADNKSRLMM